MFCAYCSEEFTGKPIIQGGEYFCSLECANLASGLDSDDIEGYYEEEPIQGFFLDEEEA